MARVAFCLFFVEFYDANPRDPASDKGIFLTWVRDYNRHYTDPTRDDEERRIPLVFGFDVQIDFLKRQQFCSSNGITIDINLFSTPVWRQTTPIGPGEQLNVYYNLEPYNQSISSGYTISEDIRSNSGPNLFLNQGQDIPPSYEEISQDYQELPKFPHL